MIPIYINKRTWKQMDTKLYIQMIQDQHFNNLPKMQHKYTKQQVEEMIQTLKEISYKQITLQDFNGNNCVYLPAQTTIDTTIIKKLLTANNTDKPFGLKAMEEEIDGSLQIENIQSNRNSIKKILQGIAPTTEQENWILGIKKGLEFIADSKNKITEKNLKNLYRISVNNYLHEENKISEINCYRNDKVYIIGDKPYHQGLNHNLLPKYMENLIDFANQKDDIPELIKACMLHFYIAYLHPYFDGNGRTARLVHLWYLIQQGYPSTLFHAYSIHILKTKTKYYNAFTQIEENHNISKLIDMTPFINYINENVYKQIDDQTTNYDSIETYTQYLKEGAITEKEKDLWNYVLSAYGENSFSTKQLEKDFNKAAYATIRTFVQKFEKLDLLTSQHYSNRVKYQIKT
jgi:Fic family protein